MKNKLNEKNCSTQNTKRTSKGITLVALVITIIILLILAGVVINMALDSDGLFAKANEAVTKWNQSVAEEENIVENLLQQANEINSDTRPSETTPEPEPEPVAKKFTIYAKDESSLSLLSGGKIAIYKDAACTDLLQEITIQDGVYETTTMPPEGMYYVKDITVPIGYDLHTEALVYQITDKQEEVWEILYKRGTEIPSYGELGDVVSASGVGTSTETINTQKSATINLQCRHEDQVISGSKVMIWRVATIDESEQFTLCSDFADYPVDLSKPLTAEYANELAQTLSGYCTRDRIIPSNTLTAGSDGMITFSNLDCGLYLFCLSNVRSDDGLVYYKSPFLIQIPIKGNNGWYYDIEGTVEYARKEQL